MARLLTHPVFGELRWEAEHSRWFTQLLLPSGEWLDVVVDPDNEDPVSFVEHAAQLLSRAIDAERRILADAVQSKLLDLYDHWRQEGDPALSPDELKERLDLSFVRLDTVAPVILSYGLGDVFGGHCVDVRVDEHLQVRGVDLVG